MALAQTTPIGQINPASLIGQADPSIVAPRAVSVLSDAFRSGQITANDIHDRVSERAKAKEKMEIVMANRATAEAEDPALQEARRQQMLAAGAQGQLAGAQANAAMPNVNEIEQLKLQMAQNAAQVQKYPMSTKFPELAAKYSVPTPRNPDGSLDYAKMSDLGAKLIAHDAKVENAKSEWNAISKIPSADGTEIIEGVTPQGRKLTGLELKAKEDATKESFFKVTPGTVAAPVATPGMTVDTPDLRSAGEGDAAITVEPRATPSAEPLPTIGVPGVSPAGTKTAGGFSAGPPKPTAGDGGIKMTGEQQSTLAKGVFTTSLFDKLKASYATLEKDSPMLTGPIFGRIAALIFAKNWDPATAGFEASKTAILAPLVKGIFQETGVLSNVDVARYEKTMPTAFDTPEVARQKIDLVERDIWGSVKANVKTMVDQGQKLSPGAMELYDNAIREVDRIDGKPAAPVAGTPAAAAVTAAVTPATPAAPAAAAPATVQTLSTGKKGVRDAQGNWVLAP